MSGKLETSARLGRWGEAKTPGRAGSGPTFRQRRAGRSSSLDRSPVSLRAVQGLGPRPAVEDDLGDTMWRQTSQQPVVQERHGPCPGFPPTPRPRDPSDSRPLGLGETGEKARQGGKYPTHSCTVFI